MQEIMPFVSDHPMLCLAWVALLIAVIVTTVKTRFSKVNEITRGEAIRLINKEDAVIVDLRSRDDYRKGHIANALNLTSSEVKSGNLGELDKAKTKPVIVVCATGTTSREPAENLNKAGFERVYVLKEGISGWSGENLPLVRGK
ncbi:rhodanese-like domain-containing protein [Sodalis ligni]|uniref:rhodanese-like domain-containing protein n=1 Tax=Sodalis ligni TaxID=2697027 RepID=UPI00194009C6|nr:rhodanese-like domain-containing protein [Sodalis ligni]QWA11073.1 rhodanese-like domain-containing protein [Sodalis ligni]